MLVDVSIVAADGMENKIRKTSNYSFLTASWSVFFSWNVARSCVFTVRARIRKVKVSNACYFTCEYTSSKCDTIHFWYPNYQCFFAQATFVHVQKVPKKILHRKFFCTFKKGVFLACKTS